MKMQTINNTFIEVKVGDRITAIGGDGRAYIGVIGETNTILKHRRQIFERVDLSWNYWRLKKVNGILISEINQGD
tara:strand:- start:842 stop:1066 length:225 start_codon:yes stop_codon:yes gene_type:complete